MLGMDLRPVNALFGVGTATGLSDGELLERFLGDSQAARDAAFAVLVARHGPMVMGVCRRVLADPDDVDDAFQATFLVFVRKASSVRVSDSLGRWLYGVSRKVASRARLEAARRPAAAGESANSWQARPSHETELALALDEEIERLPRQYREAVRMCDLEGLALREAAERIGCPLGTVGSRLSRARDLLKSRLRRRGLATSAVAIASWLDAGQARAAVSASLLAKVTGAAGQTPAGTVPTSVGILVTAVLRGFTMMKISVSVGLCFAVGLGSIGAARIIAPQKQSKSAQSPARAFVLSAAAEARPRQDAQTKGIVANPNASQLVGQQGHNPSNVKNKVGGGGGGGGDNMGVGGGNMGGGAGGNVGGGGVGNMGGGGVGNMGGGGVGNMGGGGVGNMGGGGVGNMGGGGVGNMGGGGGGGANRGGGASGRGRGGGGGGGGHAGQQG